MIVTETWCETKVKPNSLFRMGLLFSIFCLAMQSYTRSNEIPAEYQESAPELAELYRIRTAQCLVIADLTRPVSPSTAVRAIRLCVTVGAPLCTCSLRES